MKLIAALSLALLGSGCRSAERKASDAQIDCLYQAVVVNHGLTPAEQSFLAKGCHSVWQIQTGRFHE